jgi:uncharacterized phosphosugar-binding protein
MIALVVFQGFDSTALKNLNIDDIDLINKKINNKWSKKTNLVLKTV